MKIVFTNKFLLPVLLFLFPFSVSAYGVLTHEAIIDASWEKSIVPLLKAKYPAATDSALKEAHAYAYGGAVAPDMGFYPFGSKLFTDLVHYVRSGDMVEALLRDAGNINQYAFALGFLSHYNADNYGHPLGTNRSVPLVYPKVGKKYGSVVTYGENRISHMRMEFGFDVLEIAKGNYASQSYHDFIGFKVDTALLSKAFLEIYGLNINGVFHNHFQLALETFRWVVANIFPAITKAAWVSKKGKINKQDHTAVSKHFTYKMHQREYNKQFGKGYKRPGFSSTMLSFFIRALPKIGPARALRFKAPTPQSEKYFDESFDTVMKHYSICLKQLKYQDLNLNDQDFDTGRPTADCEYTLANQTYNEWLFKLKDDKFKNISNPLKQNIDNFFHQVIPASSNKNYPKKCRKFFEALNELNAI